MLPAMKTPLTIVTGASRGLGLALARQLLAAGGRVLTISRHPAGLAAGVGVLEQWTADLADAAPVAARLEAWLRSLDPAALASATLVNNAGVISRLATLGDRMLEIGEWRLIRIALNDTPAYELYHLPSDPLCTLDRAHEQPDVVNRLKAMMHAHSKRTSSVGNLAVI